VAGRQGGVDISRPDLATVPEAVPLPAGVNNTERFCPGARAASSSLISIRLAISVATAGSSGGSRTYSGELWQHNAKRGWPIRF
jgi:hypothetical protein